MICIVPDLFTTPIWWGKADCHDHTNSLTYSTPRVMQHRLRAQWMVLV